ncbi:MAG: choice-of-anchor L domain-containing protein [Polyangiaceae bacterium]|nr:choice-of-anchor L domain-containing protein [Polyangiaceae bacterium]
MGLCNVKVDEASKKWGVIEAGFNRISGVFLKNPVTPGKNLGILKNFGAASTPLEGERIFALSTGEARAGLIDTCEQSGTQEDQFPPGFPKQGSCGTTGEPYDGIALDMKIRVPTNAKSMKFNFRFFTCEFPNYVCQQYNDVFAVLMVPNPLPTDHNMFDPVSKSANIAFESIANNPKQGNVIGVNNQSFLTACDNTGDPDTAGYVNCKGESELAGSGFEDHAASAWLTTQVPVPSGQIIYLRFAIWDSGDGALDSTTIVDNFQWSAEGGTGVVTKIDPDIN